MKLSPIQRRFLQIGLMFVAYALALFLPAGRFTWLEGWLYLLLYAGFIAANALLLLPTRRALIEERSRSGPGVKGWDQRLAVWMLLFGLGVFIVAGLDERWNGGADFPTVLKACGVVCFMAGNGVFGWAMASNPFFSAQVRIQTDRGHQVAEGGPYRLVRHPGYAGSLVATLCSPLLLDSAWAWIPALLFCAVVVIRTGLEDRTLRTELTGYAQYADKVRFRLLPGVW